MKKILCGIDFSGIQSFLYNISGEKAARFLRARSEYLDVLLDKAAQELREACGGEMLYKGGGRAYILTEGGKEKTACISDVERDLNNRLLCDYRGELYCAVGTAETSDEELQADSNRAFHEVSRAISEKKMARYSAEQILELNKAPIEADRRECKECRRTDRLNPNGYCAVCAEIMQSSGGSGVDFQSYANHAQGIRRLAVVRADADNLGQAFSECGGLAESKALSSALREFFKEEVPRICGKFPHTAVIYSGGDDLFLVGAWNEALDCIRRIREAFGKKRGGSLTLSAGIGMFPPKFPVKQMALQTADLEEAAKEHPDKNAIALFDRRFVFGWVEYEEQVLREKYEPIAAFFDKAPEQGKAYVYRILDLLRGMEERVNIARLAYTLARTERMPKELMNQIFEWAQDAKERRHLECALTLYIYRRRERED
ncbi:MAG: hypothetical protein LBR73_02880 [Oscillospiraceae bacterium]|nr:hypothetical protein [Oscillospiraceae bacterium]